MNEILKVQLQIWFHRFNSASYLGQSVISMLFLLYALWVKSAHL